MDVADRGARAPQLVHHMQVIEANNSPTYPAS